MQKEAVVKWGLFVFLSLIWGSSFILMKVSMQHLSGWQVASVRIASAGFVMLPAAIWFFRGIPRSKLGFVLLTGVLGNLLPAYLFALALDGHLGSGISGILNAFTPLCAVGFGILLYRQQVAGRQWMGLLLGLAGLVALSLSSAEISLKDDWQLPLYVLLATVCYGLNVNVVSHHLKGVAPLGMAAVSLAVVGAVAAVVGWRHGVVDVWMYDPGARLAIVYAFLLGAIGSALATALFYVLIKRAGGFFASLVTYGIPVVALGWGLLAHEALSWIDVVCLLLILSGVWLANGKSKASEVKSQESGVERQKSEANKVSSP